MMTKICDCIAKAQKLTLSESPNPDLPGIIGCLEKMKKTLNADNPTKSKLVGALGRLIMEDNVLATSDFGSELIKLADDYLEYK